MTIQPNEVLTLADAVNADLAASSARPHEQVKQLTERVTYNLMQRIAADRAKMLETLREETRVFVEECRSGKRPKYSFIPTTQEVFAKRLWDSWSEESKKLPDDCGVRVDVIEGYCFLMRSQWFIVSADPERSMEPHWNYVVDPLPSGVAVFSDDGHINPAGIVVIAPQSPWQQNYTGQPEEHVRQQEALDAPAE